MTVTKDVIRDLLPVYAAGEASVDTRALVEEFLNQDSELRALAEAARTIEIPSQPAPGSLHSLEIASLNRTRRLLARKALVSGIAWTLTALPLTSVFSGGGLVFLMARDQPDIAFSLLLNAVVAWGVYLDTCRRLRATGLETPRSRFGQVAGGCVGLLLGVSAMLVAQHWTGDQWWLRLIPLLSAGFAVWLDRRLGQIGQRSS